MSFVFQLQYKSLKAQVKHYTSYTPGHIAYSPAQKGNIRKQRTIKKHYLAEIISTKHIMNAKYILIIALDAKDTKIALSQFSRSLQTSSQERLANKQSEY